MSWIIMSVDEKEKLHFHRITAKSIIEAIERGNAFLKGAYKIVAVINAKYEDALG